MRARYKKELNKTSLTIETNQFYKEDYQMKMLRENNIEGLIKGECHHINNESHFLYDISNMCSLMRKFELVELNSVEMMSFVKDLIGMVDELQQYLLNPDCLLLDPNLIYWEKNKWNFLYLPVKSSNLSKTFHGLTEYFVKTLDYSEVEGIKMASFLHKETLQENFNLKDMLSRYEEHYKREAEEAEERRDGKGEKIKRAEEAILEEKSDEKEWTSTDMRGITTEKYLTNEPFVEVSEREIPVKGMENKDRKGGGIEYRRDENLNHPKEINENKTGFSFLGRGKKGAKGKSQRNRWGDWEDLIIE